MLVLDMLNNFFSYYNYNIVITQISNSSNVNSYLPLCTLFNVFYFVKTIFMGLLTSLEVLLDIQINTNMKDAICMATKFLLCIALLIFARGGIPRFRFDYLTKLGWIRFLSLVLLSFLIELLILSMF